MSVDVLIRDGRPEDATAMAPLLEALGYPAEPSVIRERCAALLRDDATARILVGAAGSSLRRSGTSPRRASDVWR